MKSSCSRAKYFECIKLLLLLLLLSLLLFDYNILPHLTMTYIKFEDLVKFEPNQKASVSQCKSKWVMFWCFCFFGRIKWLKLNRNFLQFVTKTQKKINLKKILLYFGIRVKVSAYRNNRIQFPYVIWSSNFYFLFEASYFHW